MPRIYMDNNATTATNKSAIDAMMSVLFNPYNASSVHQTGRKARQILEDARKKILKSVNADEKYRVIFTSSGTEANNLAINGFKADNFYLSAIEHPSILKLESDCKKSVIKVNENGIVDLGELEKLLSGSEGSALISVMNANNETGIIQPIGQVVELAKKYNAKVHTDAIQSYGKIDVDIKELGVDMMTISSHKIGGPQGTAALIVKKNIILSPQIMGGSQEQNMRAGTENIAAISGFAQAASSIKYDDYVSSLIYKLESGIKNIANDAIIFGENEDRLPNTSFVVMPNVSSETQLIHFDINGIDVSAGSACSSGKIETSHVLKAMNVSDDIAKNVIRVSLSKNNKLEEVDFFLEKWEQLYKQVNKKAA